MEEHLISCACWVLGNCQTNIWNMRCNIWKILYIQCSARYSNPRCIQSTNLVGHTRLRSKWKLYRLARNGFGPWYPFSIVRGYSHLIPSSMDLRDSTQLYHWESVDNHKILFVARSVVIVKGTTNLENTSHLWPSTFILEYLRFPSCSKTGSDHEIKLTGKRCFNDSSSYDFKPESHMSTNHLAGSGRKQTMEISQYKSD